MLVLYWSTFRTQVPYYPSGKTRLGRGGRTAAAGRPVHLIDIGSGLGGWCWTSRGAVPIDLHRHRTGAAALAGQPAARAHRQPRAFRARRLRALDFGHYDAVFAYLSPAAMTALWRKARARCVPGSMLMSYEFAIDGKIARPYALCQGPGRTLYVWHF
jgi:hypothetical protein